MIAKMQPGSCPSLKAGQLQQRAKALLVRLAQCECFPDEVDLLRSGSPVLKLSRLYQIQPFLDENGVLRVGG